MRFRVQLDMFSGPMDLLWYLVRKHELDILEISIATVTEQYVEMLTVLEQIDIDAAGDFLELATRLMEIKSRSILPRPEEAEEEIEPLHHDLVRRLLEYKKYKDAASMLEQRGQQWQNRFARQASDQPTTPLDPAEQPIQEVELWDLVSAFARVIRENEVDGSPNILYDETPIEVTMQRIRERLQSEPRLAFTSLFEPGMTRSQLVGIFLAVLELLRHDQIHAEQQELFDEIWIIRCEQESSPVHQPIDSADEAA